VIGLPSSIEMALTTQPYYRSSYVFVTRRDRALQIRSFDDPRLKHLRIGVPMVSDDGANAPPAHALARRGLIANLVQYSVYGDYQQETPPAVLVKAVADGAVDVAVAWGPLAGFFAARQTRPLDLAPVEPQVDTPFLPFVFDISMAVRRDDRSRRDMLDAFLTRNRPRINAVLAEFRVPRLDAADVEATQ
jgi:mxaJ protein